VRRTIAYLGAAARAAGLVGIVAAAGCAGPGAYVWFTDVPPDAKSPSTDYLIKVGDTLNVRVLGHEDMNGRLVVRPDGRLALPLIGEVDARGKAPAALRAELEARLKEYIVSPNITINVDESRPMSVRVLGEVSRPGSFTVPTSADMAEVMALCGGLTDFASRDRIFIVRQEPQAARIRFTYEAVSRNESGAASFPLHPNDLIVVE
jgi:polysaccharide export outer membrane protein